MQERIKKLEQQLQVIHPSCVCACVCVCSMLHLFSVRLARGLRRVSVFGLTHAKTVLVFLCR
jgi:hypothetical protein